jgi:5-enolpyruvylshikimate-3-phosphate synthase
LTAPGESIVQDTDCIETSFPDFHACLSRLRSFEQQKGMKT